MVTGRDDSLVGFDWVKVTAIGRKLPVLSLLLVLGLCNTLDSEFAFTLSLFFETRSCLFYSLDLSGTRGLSAFAA